MKKILSVLLALCVVVVFHTYTTEAAEFRTVKVVSGSSLVMKEKATTNSKTLTTLKKGDLVTVFSTTNGWAKVDYKGQTGFVNGAFLGTPKPTIKIANSKGGLVVKASPSPSAKTVQTLKYNMIVEDFGHVGSGWSFVQYGNVTGYVNSKFIGTASTKKQYTSADVAVRNIASKSGAQVATLKNNTEVTVHSTLAGWSYVTAGTVRGYIPAAQLTAKKPVTGLGFYQGMVPQHVKTNEKMYYTLSNPVFLEVAEFDQVSYAGSKNAGTFSLHFNNYQFNNVLKETTTGFFVKGPVTYDVDVRVDYPLVVGKQKKYSAYQESAEMTNTYTTTVKAVNGSYTINSDQLLGANGKKFTNAIIVEVVDQRNLKGTYVFQLNKGLVYAKQEHLDYGPPKAYQDAVLLSAEELFN